MEIMKIDEKKYPVLSRGNIPPRVSKVCGNCNTSEGCMKEAYSRILQCFYEEISSTKPKLDNMIVEKYTELLDYCRSCYTEKIRERGPINEFVD